ncbi:MAG: dTDP-4-dehydrorhamnose reductase [Polyangiales bacterium]
MADIVLISPDGMLGRAWSELLTLRGLAFDGVSYPAFDITNADHVARAVPNGTRWVINCAAYTDVDGAETHEADAVAVNATGVQLLAQRCRAVAAVLVHYSTDYVFDGGAERPYRVDEPRRPQNAYGRSKARGEELLVASECPQLVIRTSWLYAAWGKNFVDTIAKASHERPSLRVVNDQRGRPTSARYLAERSLALLVIGARGIFHVTDGGECTWFEFARDIVAGSGGRATVEPCTSAEFQRPAPRPAYSVLDLSATEALLGASRSWRDNLSDVLRERANKH